VTFGDVGEKTSSGSWALVLCGRLVRQWSNGGEGGQRTGAVHVGLAPLSPRRSNHEWGKLFNSVACGKKVNECLWHLPLALSRALVEEPHVAALAVAHFHPCLAHRLLSGRRALNQRHSPPPKMSSVHSLDAQGVAVPVQPCAAGRHMRHHCLPAFALGTLSLFEANKNEAWSDICIWLISKSYQHTTNAHHVTELILSSRRRSWSSVERPRESTPLEPGTKVSRP
jgi:hypothetical protein